VTAGPGPRRRPLAWRLGLVLGITVLGVLLVTGLLVNRVVSARFESVLTGQQAQRVEDAAADLAALWDRPARIQARIARLALTLGGEITVTAADGTTIAAFGRTPDGDTATSRAPIEVGGVEVGTVEAVVPATSGDRGFLVAFDVALIVAGLVAVVVIAGLSTLLADRFTRPLRDVAAAARRLELGETGARASGGDDAESAELADAFNAMADRLERSEMLRRRAASDLAHDLATPATVLESQLQAMLDGVVPTDRPNLEAARATATALAALVGELGDLAEAEAAPLQATPAPVVLDRAAAVAVAALEGLARERRVELGVAVPSDLVAWADAGHVARALQNVVSNGIAHSRPGGVVVIDGASTGSTVELRVSDAGPGIDAADLPHIFERFYQADRARSAWVRPRATGDVGPPEERTGHGLGLTIARELLVANGGSIEVESTGPSGTTFRITLPRWAAAAR
jgi:two-component system sensor histidine kinase BaeS